MFRIGRAQLKPSKFNSFRLNGSGFLLCIARLIDSWIDSRDKNSDDLRIQTPFHLPHLNMIGFANSERKRDSSTPT